MLPHTVQFVVGQSKKAKEREEKEAKAAEQAAKDADEQRKRMGILKANTWTVGAVLWTLFDEKGQSMLQRCCRVDPAASPEAEVRSKLAALTQEEVDGFIDKTFARSEYGPLRVTIRGLLQVHVLYILPCLCAASFGGPHVTPFHAPFMHAGGRGAAGDPL